MLGVQGWAGVHGQLGKQVGWLVRWKCRWLGRLGMEGGAPWDAMANSRFLCVLLMLCVLLQFAP